MSSLSLLYKSLLAALAVLLLAAGGASAFPTTVRVEAPASAGGLLPRTSVDLDPAATVTRPGTAGDVTCAGDSPVAALDRATGGVWSGTGADASAFTVTRIKNGLDTSMILVNPPSWIAYIGAVRSRAPCTDHVPANTEVLFYPLCAARKATNCWTGEPMAVHLFDTGNFATTAENVTFGSPLAIYAMQAGGGQWGTTATALISTDEGSSVLSNATLRGDGIGFINLQNAGPHTVTVNAQDGSAPPSRLAVCSTDGGDGNCGTVRDAPPPFVVTNYPSDCLTNGHDGNCGTPDTSGPVATVINIKDRQVFKKKRGPGQVKGTLALDPNGVGGVQMRLTRTVRTRVRVKVRTRKKARKGRRVKVKYRYKTVTRCTQWNDSTALLQSMRRCGTRYGTWFAADVGDPVSTFSYGFAMTLPAGSYVLEVKASDENRYIDAPAIGRNVIRFTVK
jgi:hypothetical protein